MLLVKALPLLVSASAGIIITLWQAIRLFKAKYKKPLVWTPRAKRIYGVMLALSIVIAGLCGIFAGVKGACIALTAMLTASPVILLTANVLLRPVEKAINRRYYNEAAEILASMPDLKIIGITGSYGKTSTKHYLYRILQEHFSTVMTPGSFNTTLGVIRTVREHLQPYNEVFIVEMGAKQPGDIKEICDLVHPHAGIITAVGEQHLESFKTIQNVQATKFELADAIPADGVVVVNNDFPYVANRDVKNTHCLRYAVSNPDQADFKATEIEYSPAGTTFTIEGASLEQPLKLQTRLVGGVQRVEPAGSRDHRAETRRPGRQNQICRVADRTGGTPPEYEAYTRRYHHYRRCVQLQSAGLQNGHGGARHDETRQTHCHHPGND